MLVTVNAPFSRTVQRFLLAVIASLVRSVFATVAVLAAIVHHTVDEDHRRRTLPNVVVL